MALIDNTCYPSDPVLIIATSGNYTIPSKTRSWGVSVESGNAYFNGVGPITAGHSLKGGGYAGYTTLNDVTIGITGGKAFVIYEL